MSLCQYEDYVNGKVTDSTTGFGIQMSPEVTASVQLNKNGEIRFGTKWMKRLNSKYANFCFRGTIPSMFSRSWGGNNDVENLRLAFTRMEPQKHHFTLDPLL